jgi:hypothetical protein
MPKPEENVRVVGLRDRKEVFTLPPLEKPVILNGRETIKEHAFQTIIIPRGGTHTPRSQKELEALKQSTMRQANGGSIYKLVKLDQDAADEAQEEASAADGSTESPAPERPTGDTSTEPTSEGQQQIDDVFETVTSKAEAAEILMNAPFDVDRQTLLTDAGNLSKRLIRDKAEDFGVSFPNL